VKKGKGFSFALFLLFRKIWGRLCCFPPWAEKPWPVLQPWQGWRFCLKEAPPKRVEVVGLQKMERKIPFGGRWAL